MQPFNEAPSSKPDPMAILDTHMHLVYPDRFTYASAEDDPELRAPSTFETYKAQARPLGITSMIHMEVDVAESDSEAETRFVTGIADDSIIGAVSACRPEKPDFPDFLARAEDNPKILGFRRVLHTQSADIVQSGRFQDNIKRLGARYTFDLCAFARQLPVVAALARACPDVTFVLDHCGIPDVRSGSRDPWRRDILELASLGNVACKISGIIAYGDPAGWTVNDLKPYFEHCISSFGWDRVVWGSDWPICTRTADLTRWVSATHLLLQGCSEAEKASLLSRNAIRIYRTGSLQEAQP
jgi:predicted TIM-barrel fold metal-dependent hydrolase